jgi:beta-ring hydroxylase
VWNLHRNPRLWENPDKFDPDRFPIDERMPNEVTQNYAYLPFGGGQRKCVGDQFALFESIVTLAMVCAGGSTSSWTKPNTPTASAG